MTSISIEERVKAPTTHHTLGGKQKVEAKPAQLIEEVKAQRADTTQGKPSIEVKHHILEYAHITNHMM